MIDRDDLRKKAAPNDETPVVVTARWLAQAERELTAGAVAAANLRRYEAVSGICAAIATQAPIGIGHNGGEPLDDRIAA